MIFSTGAFGSVSDAFENQVAHLFFSVYKSWSSRYRERFSLDLVVAFLDSAYPIGEQADFYLYSKLVFLDFTRSGVRNV